MLSLPVKNASLSQAVVVGPNCSCDSNDNAAIQEVKLFRLFHEGSSVLASVCNSGNTYTPRPSRGLKSASFSRGLDS